MAPRAPRQRSPRSFIPKTEQGDFVYVKDGKSKIAGTVISRSDTEIVVSERGKYGAPQLHVINTKKEDVVVAPTKAKKISYRNDAAGFVDPFRKRGLTSELALIKSQNALDFSVQGYDVKKDEFYIEGRLNAGSPFGKWVSAKDLIPFMDVHARGGVTSPDELIRNFASAIGQSDALTDRPKETAETPKQEQVAQKTDEKENKSNETSPEPEDEEEAHSEDAEREQADASLIETLKALRHQPGANEVDVAPLKAVPSKTASPRPDLKSTATYVQDRIDKLRGKTADDPTVSRKGAEMSAQAGRSSIVLGDVAFTSGAAVPALVLAYANAGTGRSPDANQAAWQQALNQMEGLSQGLSTRLSERRAQFEVLSIAGAPPSLIAESRSRVSALEGAEQNSAQTLGVARGRHSAQEMAQLQTARQVNRPSSGSLAQAQSIQSMLNEMRGGGQNQGQGGSAGETAVALQHQAATSLGADFTVELQNEVSFETGVSGAIEHRLQELQREIRTLQDQIAATQNEGAEVQAELERSIATARGALQTLETARGAQQERLAEAKQALIQAKSLVIVPPAQTISTTNESPAPDGPGTVAVRTLFRNQQTTPPEGSSTPKGRIAAGSQGAPTGIPTPSPISRNPLNSSNSSRGGIGRPGTALGGGGVAAPGAIRPLNPLPLGGAASEFAALDRDRQVAKRRNPNPYDDTSDDAVTDVPQKRWVNTDEDEADLDDSEEENAAAFREQNEDWNDYLHQFQSGSADDGENIFGKEGNDREESSSVGSALPDRMRQSTGSGDFKTDALAEFENFGLLASARAAMARSEAARAQALGQASAAKIAVAKRKRLQAVEKEIVTKAIDFSLVGIGFAAILPTIKYLGNIFISAANRSAGTFALQRFAGYRPELPKGVQPDALEQSWDRILTAELFIVLIGMMAIFLLVTGVLLVLFFYFFGPILGVISDFCHFFGPVCHVAATVAQ